LDIANEITAKVMGEILAKGMSLSEVDLRETVDSEAVRTLGRIKDALSCQKDETEKLEQVQKIVNEYNVSET